MASPHQIQAQVAQALSVAKQAQERLATMERTMKSEKDLAAKQAKEEQTKKELLVQSAADTAKAADRAAAKKDEKGPARIPGSSIASAPPSTTLGRNPGLNVGDLTRKVTRALPRMC